METRDVSLKIDNIVTNHVPVETVSTNEIGNNTKGMQRGYPGALCHALIADALNITLGRNQRPLKAASPPAFLSTRLGDHGP